MGDFPLEGHHHAFRAAFGLGQFDQDRGSDRIREIGDQLPVAPVARRAPQIVKRVGGNQCQPAGRSAELGLGVNRRLSLIQDGPRGSSALRVVAARQGEFLSQEIHQPPVLLDGKHFTRSRQQQFGQGPQSRTDFQNLVGGLQVGRRHNPAQLIRVVQKILAERFGQSDVARRQDLFHLRELHSRSKTLANAATAASSWRPGIVKGGVKLMTFACSPSGSRMKPR